MDDEENAAPADPPTLRRLLEPGGRGFGFRPPSGPYYQVSRRLDGRWRVQALQNYHDRKDRYIDVNPDGPTGSWVVSLALAKLAREQRACDRAPALLDALEQLLEWTPRDGCGAWDRARALRDQLAEDPS